MPANSKNSIGLSIFNEGELNPTLLYNGKPILKIGPIPEIELFGFQWDSDTFKHSRWLEWMRKYNLEYGRVYPESGLFPSYVPTGPDVDGRMFPFKLVRWEGNQPIIDLEKSNIDYWHNMARIIEKCAKQEIVLHFQLYQRCYFEQSVWSYSFYNPKNNINDFKISKKSFNGIETGYNYFKKMLDDPKLWQIHETYVLHILEAINNNGNVFIDLMNEAGEWNHSSIFRRWGMSKEWVERTLGIIQRWEKGNNTRILKGMYLHCWDDEEYIKSNPRMDLNIIPANYLINGIVEQMWKYKKPIVIVHNNFTPYWPAPKEKLALKVDDSMFNRKRFYQWMGMTQKVQGLGVYAKDSTKTDLISINANEYGKQSKILMGVFKSIKDYSSMHQEIDHFLSGPGYYKTMLVSEKEMLVYLHTEEFGKTIAAGEIIDMAYLPLPNGKVDIKIIHPSSGEISTKELEIINHCLSIELPEFFEDIAIYVSK